MNSEVSDGQEVAVRRFGAEGSEVAVFEFQGELRDLIVANLREGFLATGSYTEDARSLAPHTLQSMAFAGAGATSTALSASFAGTLFMATANPATLMQLGSGGFSSAVMGAGGIVAHAGFVPVAASLPFVAPIVAMQAIQTAIILQQFKKVDQKLVAIKDTLDEAIARSEATHAGELLAASEMVDEVYEQYELIGTFSPDMLMRLAIAERDLRSRAQRFRFLVETQTIAKIDDIAGVQRANFDAYSAMLASFLELRLTYLRVCVDLQENAKAASVSVESLKSRISAAIEFWERMLKRSEDLSEEIHKREVLLKDMNWVERTIGKGADAAKKLKTLSAAYVSTLQSELAIVKGFDALIRSAKQTLDDLSTPSLSASPTLVYWEDEAGQHSFSTEKLTIAAP